MSPRPALLIGSVPPLPTSDNDPHRTVLKYFAEHSMSYDQLAGKGPLTLEGLPFYQDPSWSGESLKMLSQLPEVTVLRRGNYPDSEKYSAAPILKLQKGKKVSPDQLDWGIVRRTRQAIAAYNQIVSAYTLLPAEEDDQTVPLQIGINVIDMLVLAFRTGAEQALDSAIQRLYWDLTEVWEITNGNVIFMLESPMVHILANATLCKAHGMLKWFAGAFLRVLKVLPEGAKWGFHFCNGRVGGRALLDTTIAHLVQLPKLVYNYRWTVELSNFLFDYFETHGFSPTFVHYPLVLGNRKPNFEKEGFLQFQHLRLSNSTRIYFGAIHPQRRATELTYQYEWLDTLLKRDIGSIGVSGTCGWGSSTVEEMAQSLVLMREVAYR